MNVPVFRLHIVSETDKRLAWFRHSENLSVVLSRADVKSTAYLYLLIEAGTTIVLIRVLKITFLSLLVTLVAGCGESEEEKEFHRQLLDKALNDETKQMGTRFLAENAQREGVVVTASGLQYEVLQAAEGPRPRPLDKVSVRYSGWTVDGEMFESTAEAAKPAVFIVKDVIKGWQLALRKMSPGARWKIYLPSELAYGARSPGGRVPANSALIFEIEMLEILPEGRADE